MTFEEIEDDYAHEDESASVRDIEPERKPSPSAAPSKPSDDGRWRIVIEEDYSDEEDSGEDLDEKNDSDEASDVKHVSDSSASRKDASDSSIDPVTAARALKAAGDDAFKRGEMETADAAYGACLSHPGASSDQTLALAVRANRAAARLKLGDFVGAEEDACAALAIDPSHVKATHRRAAARIKLGKCDDALADYAVVKRAFPKHRGVAAEVNEALAMAAEAKKKAPARARRRRTTPRTTPRATPRATPRRPRLQNSRPLPPPPRRPSRPRRRRAPRRRRRRRR